MEEKMEDKKGVNALNDFRAQYPLVTSSDLQAFVIGYTTRQKEERGTQPTVVQQLKAEIAALITEYIVDIERGEQHRIALFIHKLRQLSDV